VPARGVIPGAAGPIEIASDIPGAPVAVAVIAHPHPLFGGTMDNKVVTTLERAFRELGAATLRFNFRGVGQSAGAHDEGRGEAEDMLRVIEHARTLVPDAPLWLAGFSFGGAVATRASLGTDFAKLVLVAPGFRRLTGEGMGTPIDPADPQFGEPGRHTHENTVVIHGDLDETVPLSDSLGWAAAREVNVVVIAGGEHFFHRKLHLLRDAVTRMVRP
jgi:alpha/beta superfamily hydrolase